LGTMARTRNVRENGEKLTTENEKKERKKLNIVKNAFVFLQAKGRPDLYRKKAMHRLRRGKGRLQRLLRSLTRRRIKRKVTSHRLLAQILQKGTEKTHLILKKKPGIRGEHAPGRSVLEKKKTKSIVGRNDIKGVKKAEGKVLAKPSIKKKLFLQRRVVRNRAGHRKREFWRRHLRPWR